MQKLELENVTHRDVLQKSLREIGDTGDDKIAKKVIFLVRPVRSFLIRLIL